MLRHLLILSYTGQDVKNLYIKWLKNIVDFLAATDTKIKIRDPSKRRILANKYFTFETPRGLYPQIRNKM